MIEQLTYYYRYYLKSAGLFWNNLQPLEYGSILMLVGVIGWWMMRGKIRR